MGHTKLDMFIDYYLGDDSVTTNQRAVRRFARHASNGVKPIALTDIGGEVVEAHVSNFQARTVRWPDHSRRAQESGRLSPFAFREEVRILKGLGSWLQQEGYESGFGGLPAAQRRRHP